MDLTWNAAIRAAMRYRLFMMLLGIPLSTPTLAMTCSPVPTSTSAQERAEAEEILRQTDLVVDLDPVSPASEFPLVWCIDRNAIAKRRGCKTYNPMIGLNIAKRYFGSAGEKPALLRMHDICQDRKDSMVCQSSGPEIIATEGVALTSRSGQFYEVVAGPCSQRLIRRYWDEIGLPPRSREPVAKP